MSKAYFHFKGYGFVGVFQFLQVIQQYEDFLFHLMQTEDSNEQVYHSLSVIPNKSDRSGRVPSCESHARFLAEARDQLMIFDAARLFRCQLH